jgi:hypothetical protein
MPNITTDFSGRDFTSNFEWLLTLLRQDVPELTDLNHSDAGVSLIRLLSRETDLLNQYLDQAFAEGFLLTAKFYQSLIDLAKLVDCLPKLPAGATTDLTISRKPDLFYDAQDVTLPRGTQFLRLDSLPYVCLTDVFLPVGMTTRTVPVVQGELVSLTLSPSDFTEVDLMGRPVYNLGQNVAARTVSVSHNNGNSQWTEVESFYRSFSDDLHYRLELYADEYKGETLTVFLVLGNGDHGSSVPNTPMQVSFVRTSGTAGNTGAGTINKIDAEHIEMLTINNPSIASGGCGPEDIEAFRDRIQYVVWTQRRGVTKLDYEILVRSISGISDCQCVDRNQVKDFPWEYIAIYLVPEGGGVMSAELRSTTLSKLQSIGCLGGWRGRYVLLDAIPVPVPIVCRIGVVPGFSRDSVVAALQIAIQGIFIAKKGIVGNSFSFSLLNLVAGRVPGVSWVEFDSPREDIRMTYGQYPVFDNVSVTVVE